ncbi:MAG: FAD-linked oxidase C-terminal domain-containing protein, partial [Alphaproteobacteria bacterium]
VERFVRGEPEALLLVEFAEDDQAENLRRLERLDEAMADLGFPGSVVEAVDPAFQAAIGEVRKSGLNIIMSMKSAGKPISFVEDCAVALDDLAEYTARLTRIFERHGTRGTWYAHASVGCLHVRPILNLKLDADVRKMRAIAEEAFAMVRDYQGSHSGEHGDGIARSEFHEAMFGARMVGAFEAVKDAFDPDGRLNPGRVVRPPRMDDRSLFRYPPDYRVRHPETALDWSDWGGFGGAVEMCNNNGACRKLDAGVMCPSYRVTRDERHVVRGRANALRLAISGQLGPDALTAPEMQETMALCVGCKGCRRECPTGVDMARMKIEVLHQHVRRHGLSLRDRAIGYLPRYAPLLARAAVVANLRDRVPGLARLTERVLGLAARRPLPRWSRAPFSPRQAAVGPEDGPEVVLLGDTFNRYFEPDTLHAAVAVLTAAGYRVHFPQATDGGARPLCCGRTFLAVGLVDEARAEARRSLAALGPFLERGAAVIGLEPSCLLTFRDEVTALLPGVESGRAARQAVLLEEFLAAEAAAGRLALPLKPLPQKRALLHGHCHQKAFAAVAATEAVLKLIPGLEVETVESSCCGMAGAFGYGAETLAVSLAMGELSLLPAVRAAAADTLIVADGTSCRQQIATATPRRARHAALVLRDALA